MWELQCCGSAGTGQGLSRAGRASRHDNLCYHSSLFLTHPCVSSLFPSEMVQLSHSWVLSAQPEHSGTACKASSGRHSFGFKSQCSALCKAPGERSGGISGSPQSSGCRRIFCQFFISLLGCVSVPVRRSGITLVPILCMCLSWRFMKWYFQGVKHYLSQVLWSIDNKWDKHWVV